MATGMWREAALALGFSALCAGMAGCASHGAAANSQAQAADHAGNQPALSASSEGPHVAAGTQLTVRLTQNISTKTAYPQQPFTAVVEKPLRASNGTVLVPSGALLHGEVAEVSKEPPTLTLNFTTIETDEGRAPISVDVLATDKRLYRVPAASVGSPAYGFYDRRMASELMLPRGGQMHIVLTQPLVAPSSNIALQR